MQMNHTGIPETDVFEFTDFRLFIRNRYRYLKTCDKSLTYERLGKIIGFSSPGFFTQIIQGKCRLPSPMIQKIALALGLNKKESQYFALLVEYGQASEQARKHELFKKVFSRTGARGDSTEENPTHPFVPSLEREGKPEGRGELRPGQVLKQNVYLD
jgi:uncharacterized protein (TIGR02147 family)